MLETNEKVRSRKATSESINEEIGVTIEEKEEICKNIQKNLEFLKKKLGITDDRTMAAKLNTSASQYSRYKKGELFPSLDPFLITLHKKRTEFHCTVDDFLFTDMSEKEEPYPIDLPTAIYMKFEGLFQAYYFDTSAYKGREFAEDSDALKSGLLYMYHDPEEGEVKNYYAVAVLNMKKEEADKAYADIMRAQWRNADIKEFIINLGGSSHIYKGNLELSEKHMFLSLRYENLKDKVQMIFHRPSSSSEQYIGGLGMMLSVSKGNSASPCVQSIALSKESLYVSAEELASHLLMHYPKIKTYEPSENLSNMLIQLYRNEKEQGISLTDEQKKMLVQADIDKIVNDVIEKNLFRTEVVTTLDDDDFYHYLKSVRKNMKNREG